MHLPRRLLVAVLALGATAAPAVASTSHEGWPAFTGVLLMNKNDASRPLDGRPGQDPFGGTDASYSCDGVNKRGACQARFVADGDRRVMTDRAGHNKLLGGHGSDKIHAGPWGDVIWGDYKPSGQPTSQRDTLTGGAGNDFIYASHGLNRIHGGAGNDKIRVNFGHGTVDCGPGTDTLYAGRRARRKYKITGCEHITRKTSGR